ncbi:hypothetical protein EMMF5_006364 [Cystobasidiomycetes sp. EMM_F5]
MTSTIPSSSPSSDTPPFPGTANGFKASITLEELHLEYTPRIVNLMTQMQKEEWYTRINPNGRIPALQDGETRVFESGAIMLYLTEKYDKDRKISFEPGTGEYTQALSWLFWQVSGLGPSVQYLVKDKYSIADIASFAAVRTLPPMLGITLEEYPNIKRWSQRISEREEVKKGLLVGAAGNETMVAQMFAGRRAKIAAMSNSDLH